MTPDDEARLIEQYRNENEPTYETQFTPQPRQNVLLEAGMALGRNPARTVLIEVGELRPISDIVGRHTVRLNNSVGKRQDIIDRLENAQCAVNIKGKRDWQTVGNFELEISPSQNTEEIKITDKPNSNIKKLPTECENILKVLVESNREMDSTQISNSIKIDLTKTEYFLDILTDRDLVSYSAYIDYGNFYYINKDGRKYYFEIMN